MNVNFVFFLLLFVFFYLVIALLFIFIFLFEFGRLGDPKRDDRPQLYMQLKAPIPFSKIFFLFIIGQMMGDASLEKCLVKQLCLIYFKRFRFYLELCCNIFLKYVKDKFKDRCCNIYPYNHKLWRKPKI